MATTKEPKKGKKKSKNKKTGGIENLDFPEKFYRLIMEVPEDYFYKLEKELPEEPDLQAQEIIYDAWELDDPDIRVKMANLALCINPDCADAYNTLAEDHAQTWEERFSYYTLGLAVGRRALGDHYFENEVGYFWDLLETRPYMRARLGLTECLDQAGATEKVIENYREMLRLNPNDNQGIRHFLIAALLKNGDDKGVIELLMSHRKDYSVEYTYANALMSFKKYGNSAKSKKHLKEALKFNQYVPGFLLGAKSIPEELPPYSTVGQEDEAAHYFEMFGGIWRDVPGALEWLKSETRG